MSFYICHCGNTSHNHNFRHQYESITQVTCDIDDDCNECYTLNADDFPVKTSTRCSKPNCSSDMCIHGTEIIQHAYDPKIYTYRDVKLTLPADAQCSQNNCKQLKDHRDIMTHHFTTKVVVQNLQENDIVTISDPEDEDVKIIWK